MVPVTTVKSSNREATKDSIESVGPIELFAALEREERALGASAPAERASANGGAVSSEDLHGPDFLGVTLLLVFQGAIFFAIGFFVARWTH